MAETLFVQGAGGAIFEMDVPTEAHKLELWNEKLDKGELVIIPAAVWVERGDGTKYLVVPSDDVEVPAKGSRRRGPKSVADVEPSGDGDGVEDDLQVI